MSAFTSASGRGPAFRQAASELRSNDASNEAAQAVAFASSFHAEWFWALLRAWLAESREQHKLPGSAGGLSR
jgi:hypothetical protein